MAKYNLKCSECEFEHKVRQSINDPLPEECPECGESTLQPLLAGVGTIACSGADTTVRAKNLAKKDVQRLKKGKDKDLLDLAGDKPNPLKQQN